MGILWSAHQLTHDCTLNKLSSFACEIVWHFFHEKMIFMGLIFLAMVMEKSNFKYTFLYDWLTYSYFSEVLLYMDAETIVWNHGL